MYEIMISVMTGVLLLLATVHLSASENSRKEPDSKDFQPKNYAAQQAISFRTNIMSLQNNAKISLLEGTSDVTEMSTTLMNNDENTTTSEDDSPTTTESIEYNSTDFPNSTNTSIIKNITLPTTTMSKPKKITSKEKLCSCDITFLSCDVNCCCDEDCEVNETKLFSHCMDTHIPQDHRYCYSHIFYYKNNTGSKIFETDNLFCIAKDNLPRKRDTDIHHKITDPLEAEKLTKSFYKWPENHQPRTENKYKAMPYIYGDPVWSYNDSDFSMIDVPAPYLNDYCHRRKPVRFLRNSKHKCIAKVVDLEMFNVYKNLNRTLVAGPHDTSDDNYNLIKRNCSTIYCIQWDIIMCDDSRCDPFNKSKHSASCDDTFCVNIAARIKYVFHCFSSRINRAEIYLYASTIRTDTQYLQQEIVIKYYLEKQNKTDTVVDLSGNPGYHLGKPIIKARRIGEDTLDIFTNNSYPLKNVISFPKNVNGVCILSNSSHETIGFGYNMKNKCSYSHIAPKNVSNGTDACNLIQNNLFSFLGLNDSEQILISPLGNPSLVTKEDWIDLVFDKPDGNLVRGEFLHKVLRCYSFVSFLSYEFTYANVSQSDALESYRKVLRSVVRYSDSDIEFDLEEDIFITISTNVLFFDITKPVKYEYARGPHLDIHLPNDFFYPFTSNHSSSFYKGQAIYFICTLCIVCVELFKHNIIQ